MKVFCWNRKRNIKNNLNKGFSLIEVLMAVVLLGLIAAPILQMFYSSFELNQKSRRYLGASDFMQTIMEGITAQTWEDSTPVASGSTAVPGLSTYYTSFTSATVNTRVPLFNQTSTETGLTIPTGIYGGADASNPDKIVYSFKNVNCGSSEFNGKFDVKISVDTSNGGGSKNYYAVPVTVRVFNAGGDEIQSAETSILNIRTKQ